MRLPLTGFGVQAKAFKRCLFLAVVILPTMPLTGCIVIHVCVQAKAFVADPSAFAALVPAAAASEVKEEAKEEAKKEESEEESDDDMGFGLFD